jgi:hypothetical protein
MQPWRQSWRIFRRLLQESGSFFSGVLTFSLCAKITGSAWLIGGIGGRLTPSKPQTIVKFTPNFSRNWSRKSGNLWNPMRLKMFHRKREVKPIGLKKQPSSFRQGLILLNNQCNSPILDPCRDEDTDHAGMAN